MAEDIVAPMPGKIVSLNIEPGASIEADTEVMVIEAMKMETIIYAPCDGVIDKVLKKVGDEVEESEVIATVS